MHGVGGVASDLVELVRRRCLHESASQAPGEPHALAVDIASGVLKQLERVGRLAEVDADLLEDRLGVVLDRRQALLAQQLPRFQLPRDEGHPFGDRGEASGRPSLPSAGQHRVRIR